MTKINLCLIGDFSAKHDEGAKNVAFNLSRELSNKASVIILDEKDIFSRRFIRSVIRSQKPQIIHYFTDPSFRSLVFLKLLAIYWRGSKTVVSALHPDINPFLASLYTLFRPDEILVQSGNDLHFFQRINFKTGFLSNGVEVNKFMPPDPEARIKLREKYGIRRDQFLVLHVGHIKANRNLELFTKMSGPDVRFLVVASEYIEVDDEISRRLKESGVMIRNGFMENIHEIYSISDCYVFPVEDNGAITTPLSVLEAMACNLPVVTRKFSGLDFLFTERDGFFFADNDAEFIEKIQKIKAGLPVKTREMVSHYTWENISLQLIRIYNNLQKSHEGVSDY